MNSSAAVQLYPHLDAQLQQAFYSCFRTHGKIATKKLMSSFVDSRALVVANHVISLTRYGVEIPRQANVCHEKAPGEEDLSWLANLPAGPGVSGCVMRTCSRILQELKTENTKGEKQSGTIDTLYFLEVLSATAEELSRLVKQHGVDVPRMVAQERSNGANLLK